MTEQPAAVDPQRYRRVVSRFATGVTVVSTVQDGVRYGMTVNSFTSVSLDPLQVLFCCEIDCAFYEPVTAAGVWGVSILPVDRIAVAKWFATRGQVGVDQFVDQQCWVGEATGVPLLDGALAALEVRTSRVYDGGDHKIVLGDVVSAWAAPLLDDASTAADARRDASAEPLVYYASGWRTTAPLDRP